MTYSISARAKTHSKFGDIYSDWLTVTIYVKGSPIDELPEEIKVPEPTNEQTAPHIINITVSGSAGT